MSLNSSAFADYAQYKGFRNQKITPVWPLANGEAERFMRTVKKAMKAAISEGKSWNQELNTFLLNYRATPHSTTGVPPATLLFNIEIKNSLPQISINNQIIDIRQADDEAKAKMKSYADVKRHAKGSQITVGDCINEEGRKRQVAATIRSQALHGHSASRNNDNC